MLTGTPLIGTSFRPSDDPDQRADEIAVFWHPDELTSVIILKTAPSALISPQITFAELSRNSFRRDAKDGTHLMIRDGGVNYQLWLPGRSRKSALVAALIPLDAGVARRADATLQFWRFMTQVGPRPPPPAAERPQRIKRLIMILRALDGRLSGASYQAIADALFGPGRTTSEPWKTAPLRDTVIRLARAGFALMRGDYRKLLGPRRPH